MNPDRQAEIEDRLWDLETEREELREELDVLSTDDVAIDYDEEYERG